MGANLKELRLRAEAEVISRKLQRAVILLRELRDLSDPKRFSDAFTLGAFFSKVRKFLQDEIGDE